MTASIQSEEAAASGASSTRPAEHQLQLCGAWRLSVGDRDVSAQPTEQRLLALLALRGPQPRTTIAGLLWPRSREPHARGSLRSAIWRIRRCLPTALTCNRTQLGLDAEIDVDADLLTRAARNLMRDFDANAPTAAADFRFIAHAGDLLPGWYDDWVLIERERLHQLRMHALEAHAARLAECRRYADALEAAFVALAAEPYRESPHQLIARIHLAEGNINQAIRTFQLYQHIVVRELEPDPGETPPQATVTEMKQWLASDWTSSGLAR